MLWIMIAVAVVSLIAFLAGWGDPLGGDIFGGLMGFLAVWALFGVFMLLVLGFHTLNGTSFQWVWV